MELCNMKKLLIKWETFQNIINSIQVSRFGMKSSKCNSICKILKLLNTICSLIAQFR